MVQRIGKPRSRSARNKRIVIHKKTTSKVLRGMKRHQRYHSYA